MARFLYRKMAVTQQRIRVAVVVGNSQVLELEKKKLILSTLVSSFPRGRTSNQPTC